MISPYNLTGYDYRAVFRMLDIQVVGCCWRMFGVAVSLPESWGSHHTLDALVLIDLHMQPLTWKFTKD